MGDRGGRVMDFNRTVKTHQGNDQKIFCNSARKIESINLDSVSINKFNLANGAKAHLNKIIWHTGGKIFVKVSVLYYYIIISYVI